MVNVDVNISLFLKAQYGMHGICCSSSGIYYVHDANYHINELSHKKVRILNMFIIVTQRLGISFQQR
jgi:hypothetical protein